MYVHDSVRTKIEDLKAIGKFQDAIQVVNEILVKDPNHQEALLQIADIEYRKGSIENAEKPINFLIKTTGSNDPMSLYVKGVLEMEKNQRGEAKIYFQRALENSTKENHEIVRCYALAEYWYGNREKGIDMMENAFTMNDLDAEIIYNLVELYLLELKVGRAKNMIQHYYKKHDNLLTFDKEIGYYDSKINLFDSYVKSLAIHTEGKK